MSLDLSGLRTLQDQVGAWRTHNFPQATLEHQALQLAEETGEVCRAVNKAANGYRGSRTEHMNALADGVGDVAISLAALCDRAGIDLAVCIETAWHVVSQRDWRRFPRNGVSE